MTLVEDAAAEWISQFGEHITIYPHKGYKEDSDDIWQSDQGWDRGNPITVKARISESPTDKVLSEGGFQSDTELAIWVIEDVVNEGDLIEFDNQEWVVTSIVEQRIQGRTLRRDISAKKNA